MIIDTVKVILPSIIAFWIGIGLTPFLTGYLYKNKMWKKRAGKLAIDGKQAEIFNSLHKEKEVGTPRMGGVVIWLSAFIAIIGIWMTAKLLPGELTSKLDFLSRNQTWIPFSILIFGSLIGLFDDYLEVKNVTEKNGGLSLKKRLLAVVAIGLSAGLWFFLKLDVTGINLPIIGVLELGWLFVPFFAVVTLAIYSGGIIDGIDGLAGGIFVIIFSAYATIAFFLEQINLAAFCAMVAG